MCRADAWARPKGHQVGSGSHGRGLRATPKGQGWLEAEGR